MTIFVPNAGPSPICGRLTECDLPRACRQCGNDAPRAFLTAPYFASMSVERRVVHATNERSASAPRTLSGSNRAHASGCRCCSGKSPGSQFRIIPSYAQALQRPRRARGRAASFAPKRLQLTGGIAIVRSALVFMAPIPRAREAVKPNRPTNPHSGPGQPGARQRARSAERPAIGPTCTCRLNLAAVLADVASFLELGRSGRTMVRPPRRWRRWCRRASAARYGVNAKQAALKDQP